MLTPQVKSSTCSVKGLLLYLLTPQVKSSTCSVEGVVGVEDRGEHAKGKASDAKGHVETCVAQTLEHLQQNRQKSQRTERAEEHREPSALTPPPPLLSGSVR